MKEEIAWERTVLAHSLLSAAVASILQVLKDVDFISVSSSSLHNKTAEKSFQYALSLIDFWTARIGLNRSILEYKIVRGLFSLGYLPTMSRFSISKRLIHSTLISVALYSQQLVLTLSSLVERNALAFLEVYARRLTFIVYESAVTISEELGLLLKGISYYLLFYSFLSRCDYTALKFLLTPTKLDEAFSLLFDSVPVERLATENESCMKKKSVLIAQEAWKIFSIRVARFSQKATYTTTQSLYKQLKSVAFTHLVHARAKKDGQSASSPLLPGEKGEERDFELLEEILDEEKLFAAFAREK
jgi:hypothetical protein